MRIAVLGATGYTGMVLMRLLAHHPRVSSIIPVSRSKTGALVGEVDRGFGEAHSSRLSLTGGRYVALEEAEALSPEVVFSCLPHLASAKACASFVGRALVIDLSADFRLKDPQLFKATYGENHPAPHLLPRAVYGLAEWNHDEIARADLVANPGCYPTATLLPLLPLVKEGLVRETVTVNALSGISGAGRKLADTYLFTERTENMTPYLPGRSHRHLPEMEQELGAVSSRVRLLFTPHLVPLKQGMLVTTVCTLTREVSDEELRACYQAHYGSRPWVRIIHPSLPETRWVRGTNRCDISWKREGDHLLLFSAIDNLVKGASGQAVQNMNIRLGFPETEGLPDGGEI
ncbi:N-acetyl-gamma-glutamyl-phosphate reductase [Spirochaeta thermophila DSM 6578]|uniref:N-acetyl-gamma-glutamyl-phosphate reductase n=1 Tax=Winmispira thermophila (strain ATCC 700085 / DSM 6578 / Z-1203) TaxID=869211 RepID=G0GEH3_WINT7|nr:N-acetyl-gamma-glutamyl-phosphate reductase [Spirochaeta thermophila]AEJ62310.1 N-acetyl-gamma-glutamyl-phosphate reductase [Spirochaeta thermophila DSM 6578]